MDDDVLFAHSAQRRAADERARLAAAPGRAEALLLEEREVGARPRLHGRREARLLGDVRLPHPRRPVDRRALLVAPSPARAVHSRTPCRAIPWEAPHRSWSPRCSTRIRSNHCYRHQLRADTSPRRSRAHSPRRPESGTARCRCRVRLRAPRPNRSCRDQTGSSPARPRQDRCRSKGLPRREDPKPSASLRSHRVAIFEYPMARCTCTRPLRPTRRRSRPRCTAVANSRSRHPDPGSRCWPFPDRSPEDP